MESLVLCLLLNRKICIKFGIVRCFCTSLFVLKIVSLLDHEKNVLMNDEQLKVVECTAVFLTTLAM